MFVSVLKYSSILYMIMCLCAVCLLVTGFVVLSQPPDFSLSRADSADPGAFNRVCVADPAAFNRVCVFSGLRFTAQSANKFLNTGCVCVCGLCGYCDTN